MELQEGGREAMLLMYIERVGGMMIWLLAMYKYCMSGLRGRGNEKCL